MKKTVSLSSTFTTKTFKEGKNRTLIVSMNVILLIYFLEFYCVYIWFNVFKHFLYVFNFIFVDQTIRVVLCDGSTEVTFCLSMTSKMLLSAMNTLSMWELPVVLHLDGMFKLNENEFLVISLGVWDGAQQLNIMSLSIILHHTKDMYLQVVQGFKDIISELFPGVPFLPNYLMTDAEHAERTALVSVFHVIKASKNKLSGNKDRDVILKDITSLHMFLTQQEFDHKWTCTFNHWIVSSNSFTVYFKMQWVEASMIGRC
jgi:hypothetical protein